MKPCHQCQIRKPVKAFGVNRRNPDGRNIYCKSCWVDRCTEWKVKDRERVEKLTKWLGVRILPPEQPVRVGTRPARAVMDAKPKPAMTTKPTSTPEAKIIQALQGRSLSWREIEAETGLKEDQMDEAMGDLLESGKVKERRGIYSMGEA